MNKNNQRGYQRRELMCKFPTVENLQGSRTSAGAASYNIACYETAMNESTRAESRRAEFVACLRPMMSVAYRVAFHLTNDGADAEELVQDAALLAYRRFDSFRKGTNFKAWFTKILTNCFFMSVRQHRNRPHCMDLGDLPEDYLYEQAAAAGLCTETQDPARHFMQHLDAQQIAEAFQVLPEEYRAVCVFYFVRELSYKDIAEHLGIPVGTVRSRLHRGRKMLQKRLWPLIRGAGPIQQNWR